MTEIYLLIGMTLGIAYTVIMIVATRRFDPAMVVLAAIIIFAWPIALLAAALDHT